MRSDSIYNRQPADTWESGLRWLPWGYWLRWSGERSWSTPGSLRSLSLQSLAEVIESLPDRWVTSSELVNESGAAPDSSGLGKLAEIEYRVNESARTGTFTIATKFARFEGSREIVFSCVRSSSDEFTNPRQLLLPENGIEIERVSITTQIYARRWASLFGLFPVPVGRVTKSWRVKSEGENYGCTHTFAIEVSRQRTMAEAEERAKIWIAAV